MSCAECIRMHFEYVFIIDLHFVWLFVLDVVITTFRREHISVRLSVIYLLINSVFTIIKVMIEISVFVEMLYVLKCIYLYIYFLIIPLTHLLQTLYLTILTAPQRIRIRDKKSLNSLIFCTIRWPSPALKINSKHR